MRKWTAGLAVLMACAAWGLAEEAESLPEWKAEHYVGAGLLVGESPYRGVGSVVIPLPFYNYVGRKLTIRGTEARYRLAGDGTWSVSALARLRMEGYDADDSRSLDGMRDRGASLDAGASFGIFRWQALLEVDAVTDVTGRSDGQEARVKVVRPFAAAFGVEKLRLSPVVGLAWRSARLNDYYYGVRSRETRPGRPAYDAGSGVNYFAGLAADYQLSARWSVFALFQNEWFSGEIRRSPLVDRDSSAAAAAGVLYKF